MPTDYKIAQDSIFNQAYAQEDSSSEGEGEDNNGAQQN